MKILPAFLGLLLLCGAVLGIVLAITFNPYFGAIGLLAWPSGKCMYFAFGNQPFLWTDVAFSAAMGYMFGAVICLIAGRINPMFNIAILYCGVPAAIFGWLACKETKIPACK